MANKIVGSANHIIVEACVASVEAAIAAERGGADRLELNTALELDGLTPSLGLFHAVRAACSLPIIVMIRPRGYGFVYSDAEYNIMRADLDVLLEAGADGCAFGFLTEDTKIDRIRTREFVKQVGDRSCVFHRAFDVTPSPSDSLEMLIDCGVQRVLTSGQGDTALAGAPVLGHLVEQAAGRIEILPGSGINPDNAHLLVAQTGCTQVHGTFRKPSTAAPPTGMDVLRAPPPPGTDAGVVAGVRERLR